MLLKFKRYIIAFVVILICSVTAVFADTYVICQRKVQTGHGYYHANCSGNYVNMTVGYESSSEKYFVNNYTGTNDNRYANVVGVYSGKKSGSHSWNVGQNFSQFGHIHHFTVNLR